VVRVPGYRSRGPRSIPGATRFSSLVSTIEGLLAKKKIKILSAALTTIHTLYQLNLTLHSSTGDDRSVAIVNSRTKTMELLFIIIIIIIYRLYSFEMKYNSEDSFRCLLPTWQKPGSNPEKELYYQD
jgi:hypothetical protein